MGPYGKRNFALVGFKYYKSIPFKDTIVWRGITKRRVNLVDQCVDLGMSLTKKQEICLRAELGFKVQYKSLLPPSVRTLVNALFELL